MRFIMYKPIPDRRLWNYICQSKWIANVSDNLSYATGKGFGVL